MSWQSDGYTTLDWFTLSCNTDPELESCIALNVRDKFKVSSGYSEVYEYDDSSATHNFTGNVCSDNIPLKGVLVQKFTSSSQTFKVGNRYDVTFTTPTGYNPTNMIAIVSSGFVASFYGYISGSKVECWCAAARNIANGSNAGTGTIEVYMLFIQN